MKEGKGKGRGKEGRGGEREGEGKGHSKQINHTRGRRKEERQRRNRPGGKSMQTRLPLQHCFSGGDYEIWKQGPNSYLGALEKEVSC